MELQRRFYEPFSGRRALTKKFKLFFGFYLTLSNDGLAGSAPNLGTMLGRRHVYFVPFGQDDCAGKPASLVADFTLVPDTVEAACRGEQIQPLLLGTSMRR